MGESPPVEKAEEAADRGHRPCRRRPFVRPPAAPSEVGANVGGSELGQRPQLRRTAEMAGEEVQEGGEIASVGLQSVGREAALVAEPGMPILYRGGDIRADRQPVSG